MEIPLKKDARDETDVQCADADHTTNGVVIRKKVHNDRLWAKGLDIH